MSTTGSPPRRALSEPTTRLRGFAKVSGLSVICTVKSPCAEEFEVLSVACPHETMPAKPKNTNNFAGILEKLIIINTVIYFHVSSDDSGVGVKLSKYIVLPTISAIFFRPDKKIYFDIGRSLRHIIWRFHKSSILLPLSTDTAYTIIDHEIFIYRSTRIGIFTACARPEGCRLLEQDGRRNVAGTH